MKQTATSNKDSRKPLDSKASARQVSSQQDALKSLAWSYAKEALAILQATTKKKLRVDEILTSGRMTSTLGYAQWKYLRSRRYHYTIKLSTAIFKGDSQVLRDTVYHEVAHLVDYQLYKNWGHGHTWKQLMIKLGLQPNVYCESEELATIGYEIKPR